MQMASHGARALARKAPQTTRSIHIPSLRPQSVGLGKRLLTQTRLALTRFVTHLTTPGTGTVSSVARSFHSNPTIQQRLSFTARTTLARPLHSHFLPRGPVVPRTMAQVGLGTARNFSSGRPIFQQLADNIPIAGRAFYEADWELEVQKERENMQRPATKHKSKKPASKEMLKAKAKPAAAAAPSESAAVAESEIEHYFPAPRVPDVTTSLLIPLAPTPTARAPLPEFTSAAQPGRLPLPTLLAVHDAHETHALRVSSLFHRLDTADVWARGVVCSAYSTGAGAGVCTVLRVEFAGWTQAEVRGVIGESGTGWCVLEETRGVRGTEQSHDAYAYDEDDDASSETSSVLSGLGFEDPHPMPPRVDIDPAQSFVLPTLDFSSSFLASSTAASSTASDFFAHSNSSGSDLGSDSWSDDASSITFVDPPSENGWFGFSSDFVQLQAQARMGMTPEPRESAFA
ncbi:hypothetical protein B0H10DRAFT_1938237 [Mycena sp. CBHHK59/15]|nr:hypothetical protein B0H10DRAFT_1938237 [Mycena sp. CBHHK59/15]